MRVNSFINELSKGLRKLSVDKSILFFLIKNKRGETIILQFNQVNNDLGSNGRNKAAIKTIIVSV
jgi:hypothetical protein